MDGGSLSECKDGPNVLGGSVPETWVEEAFIGTVCKTELDTSHEASSLDYAADKWVDEHLTVVRH